MDNAESAAKYQTSSAIVWHVLKQVSSAASPGMSSAALCSYSDALIAAYTDSVYKKERKIERGVVFPTTISVNNIIQNHSPSPANDYILKEGDVVKIEAGAHIDGYMASSACTTIATNSPSAPIVGRKADVVAAAFYASEVAARMIRPGQTARDLVRALGLVAQGFNCTVAEETFTSQVDRFVMSGNNTFANRFDPEFQTPDLTFETDQIYTVDCVLSSGDGIARPSDIDPEIYQRDVNKIYSLKLRTSRALFSEVCKRYSVFPFLIRDVVSANPSLKAGINECVRAQMLVPFAVTIDKKNGAYVAQFKITVACHYTGPIRLTPQIPMPNVESATVIPQDSEIGQILAAGCQSAKLPELPRLKPAIPAPLPTQSYTQSQNAMDLS